MKLFMSGIVLLCYFTPLITQAQTQSGPEDSLLSIPSQYFNRVNNQSIRLGNSIDRQTEKYLNRLAAKESKLRKKLYKEDSSAANKLFGNNSWNYKALTQQLGNSSPSGVPSALNKAVSSNTYIPYLDSVKTSLKFIQQNPKLLAGSQSVQTQLQSSLGQVNQLQNKLQSADQVKHLISQRKEEIRQALSHYAHLPSGLQNAYQGYSREAYYYGAQLEAYKNELSDPDKLTKRALGILNGTPAFQSFMKSHSDLAGLFSVPGGVEPGNTKPLEGLQTRSEIQNQLKGQLAAGGPGGEQIVKQNIQEARAKLKALQDKIAGLGGGNSSMDIPDFKPNPMRTRSLLGRLEWGANFQSLPSVSAFPATSDIGISLGYKLSEKTMLGIGGAYRIGWGRDINHIAITNQGIGIRSFAEIRIKNSWFATGGFEYNYQKPFASFQQMHQLSDWTRSGLVGVTKKYKVNSRVKGNLQLLWDFLSYSQVPYQAAFKVRIGYSF
ncbi:hypothetical protein ACX0G9_25925 [Flavitalea flava]